MSSSGKADIRRSKAGRSVLQTMRSGSALRYSGTDPEPSGKVTGRSSCARAAGAAAKRDRRARRAARSAAGTAGNLRVHDMRVRVEQCSSFVIPPGANPHPRPAALRAFLPDPAVSSRPAPGRTTDTARAPLTHGPRNPTVNHRIPSTEREQHMSEQAGSEQARKTAEALEYLTGFGNEHSSEAVPGALPLGRNSPQRAPSASTPSSSAAAPSPNPAATTAAPGSTGSAPRPRTRPSPGSTTAPCAPPPSPRRPRTRTGCAGIRCPTRPPAPTSWPACGPSAATATRPSAPAWPSTSTPPTRP